MEFEDIKNDKRIYTLSEEKPFKAVLSLGLPLVFALLIMGMYNIVDTFFVSMLNDDFQIAAVSLSYPVMMISVALANMVGSGAASEIARSLGENKISRARHTLTMGMELVVFMGIFFSILGIIFLPQIVTLLGAKNNTYEFTYIYVSVIITGNVFTMTNYALGQLLRSEGSTKYSMIGMIAGTIANLILDPLFIFTFNMGIKGAAVATVLGNVLGTIIPVIFYISKKSLLTPDFKVFLPDKEIIINIFKVGLPSMLETMLTSIAFIINNNLAVGYGELTVTAMGISQKIISIGQNIYQGFAAGNQPLMGYNYGAKNYKRMLSVLKAGLISVTIAEAMVMCIYGFFAPFLISIFSDTKEVIAIGAKVLRTNMFCLLFVGSISMVRMSYQAIGKALKAFLITIIRQFVLYVPLLILLNKFLGFNGMIWAQPVTEAIMMAVSVIMFVKTVKSLINLT